MTIDNAALDAHTLENDEKQEIARLAALTPLQYDRERSATADNLAVTVGAQCSCKTGTAKRGTAAVLGPATKHADTRRNKWVKVRARLNGPVFGPKLLKQVGGNY